MLDRTERQFRWLLGGVGLGALALLLTLEVVTEKDGLTFAEFLLEAFEVVLIVTAAGGVTLLLQRMRAQHEEKVALLRNLEIARAEGKQWRSKAYSQLAGIRAEMEQQFDEWGLTAVEREIALLILKGLNHKAIAHLRGTTEATTRQQAQSIYFKSGLPGKTAFTAYFLEDLLSPVHTIPTKRAVG